MGYIAIVVSFLALAVSVLALLTAAGGRTLSRDEAIERLNDAE